MPTPTYKNITLSYGILLVLIGLFCCTPILSDINRTIILWFFAAYQILKYSKKRIYFNNSSLIISIGLYIALIYGYRIFLISDAPWGNYMNELFFFSMMILALLIPEWNLNKHTKKIWWILIAILSFNVADNIRLSILYPAINTSRIYLNSDFLSSINAGGSRFYTFSLLFYIIAYFVFLNCNDKKYKIIMLFVALLNAVYIIGYCYKASVVLFLLLATFLMYYAKIAVRIHLFIGILVFSVLLMLLIVGIYEDYIINFIIAYSPNERITSRMITLIDANNIEANESTVSGRTSLYMLSVQTWLTDLQTFLFGIGDHRSMFDVRRTGISQHSELLDFLAKYGMLGVLLLYTILKNILSFILSIFDIQYRLQLITIFIIFLLCGLTKALFFPSAGFTMFVLLAMTSIFINNQAQNN